MQISGLGGFPLWLPGGPVAAPAAPAPAAPPFAQLLPAAQLQQQNVAALALLQSEEHGGGGGGHGKKLNLKAIEDLAARASLQIEPRQKTPAERQAEIERLKQMQLAAAQQVGEKQPNGEGGQGRRQQPGQDQEQPPGS